MRELLFETVYPVIAEVIDQELAEYRRRLFRIEHSVDDLREGLAGLDDRAERLQRMQQLLAHQLRTVAWAPSDHQASEGWVPSDPPAHLPLSWPEPLHGGLGNLPSYLRSMEGGRARPGPAAPTPSLVLVALRYPAPTNGTHPH